MRLIIICHVKCVSDGISRVFKKGTFPQPCDHTTVRTMTMTMNDIVYKLKLQSTIVLENQIMN